MKIVLLNSIANQGLLVFISILVLIQANVHYIPRWFTISGTSRPCTRNWSGVRRLPPPPLTGGRSTDRRAEHSQPKQRQNRPPTTGVVRHSTSFFCPVSPYDILQRISANCAYRILAEGVFELSWDNEGNEAVFRSRFNAVIRIRIRIQNTAVKDANLLPSVITS